MRRVGGAQGMVTAELAVLLPALVLLLVVSLRAVGAGVAELQCVDAARAAARSAARGDAAALVHESGLSVAPRGAALSVRSSGGQVRVEVRAKVRLLPGVWLPLHAVALARSEQTQRAGPTGLEPPRGRGL